MTVEFVQRPGKRIIESQGQFKMSDGFQLSYRRWSPEEATERVVLGLHGIGWHSGQFRQMGAEIPVDVPGTELYAIDERGFGNSVEEGHQRGDISSTRRFLLDIDEVAQSLRRDHPGKKLYLFGHSLGCLLSLLFAENHPQSVDGLILAAPSVLPRKEAWPPRRSVLRFMFLRAFSPGSLVDLTKYRPEERKQSDETASVLEDPLSAHSKYSTRLLFGATRLRRKVLANAQRVRVPTLILQGQADGLLIPEGASKLQAMLSSNDKTVKTFPGADHHLYDTLPPRPNSKYDEATKGQIYETIADWLRTH